MDKPTESAQGSDSPNDVILSIDIEVAKKINFACHQNAFALLQDLRIKNHTSESLENITVTLTSDPEFIKPRAWSFSKIAAGATLPVSTSDRDIKLDGQFLLNLSEMVKGEMTFTATIEGETVATQTIEGVELLAYNEWGGAHYMPAMLAAFVMPNDPGVDNLIARASQILRRAGRSDIMDGYKSNSRERIWEMVSAIYSAMANLGLTYSVPPASYERNGQKIRLPGMLIQNKVATCLDSTILFASALEQIGLNPVIALPEGHAMVGVWLQPETLSSVTIDDAEVLRKRIQLKELIFIETTFLTQNPSPPFSSAMSEAEKLLSSEHDLTFHAAIDVARARALQLSPLGVKKDEVKLEGNEDSTVEMPLEAPPALPDFEPDTEAEPETTMERVDRWQRKLLDLTARNPLLSYKEGRASLRLHCPNPGLLEDRLAEGVVLSLQPEPEDLKGKRDDELHQQLTGIVIDDQYALDALNRKQIIVKSNKQELDKSAVEIYRKAKSAFQEGGANTLFLALGFLRWKRDERAPKAFRAPLILLPVSLDRQSVRSPFKLSTLDEEPRFNTTLLEMLRRDFGIDIRGLDGDLPTDDSGIDVNGIWNHVRKKVKDAQGFEVVEDVVLGHFSFAKYLMWKDMVDRQDALKENAVVRHLMETPRDPYQTNQAFIDKQHIDRDYKPQDLLTPLPADASQMSVIATADTGKDFIVIGPPGTGKSQTISNLIAHFLGTGKSVLFVSEKTAALNVVHRRLEHIGLGRFCLALHSNKARKTEVLDQLRNAWLPDDGKSAEAWQKEADRLLRLRDRLNQVVERLHSPRRNGMTAHYAMGIKIRDEILASRVSLDWPRSDVHDAEAFENLKQAVAKLQIQAETIGEMTDTPFYLVDHTEWSPKWEADIISHAGELATQSEKVKRSMERLLDTLKLSLPDSSPQRLDALKKVAQALLDAYHQEAGYALLNDGNDYIQGLEKAVSYLKSYNDTQSQLSCQYKKEPWRQLDGGQIAADWQAACDSWWPSSFFKKRSIIKYLRASGAHGKPDPENDAPLITQMQELGENIDKLGHQLKDLKLWHGLDTNPEDAITARDIGGKLRKAVGGLTDDPMTVAEIRGQLRTLVSDANDMLAPDEPLGRSCQLFLDDMTSLRELLDAFQSLAKADVRDAFAESQDLLSDIADECHHLQQRRLELRDWCSWRLRRNEALEMGLSPMVEAVDKGDVLPADINDTFHAAYCSWFSGALMGEDEVLRTFSSAEHRATIHDFVEVDESYRHLTAQYIAAKLSGNLPSQESVKKQSGWGLLRHEMQKQRQHKPVRTLMQEAPDVLATLAPCMMMSPLSVAQYLPAEQQLFDVVIFDEASQITVWDAIGALARGKQVIVAGDPKQMPPTSFFGRKEEDPDGEGEFEPDLESILDEMLGASIPKLTLNLHYRSRREGLIAFSNEAYYQNELVTFPAPIHPDNSVSLIEVDGMYARGGARHNEKEAKAVVDEIISRLTSLDESIRNTSIGVVTFNAEQQGLIENLLDNARAANPQLEYYFGDKIEEPVFVKNLETVQGDERDVILFSMTFGPDRSGHITMNFGPLNRTGGERRLNVALTRAREEMKVFSSLPHERINLSATQADGVRDLKHFLQYAERGPSELGAGIHGSLGDFESPFESAVAEALRDKGWKVHPQIGVSRFRIDLGVVHPDVDGLYLSGVECDGAMYHSSAYARERDKIRQSVLEGLGWTLFRIWSTDWWTHKEAAILQIDADLNALLTADRERRQKEKEERLLEAEAEAISEDEYNHTELLDDLGERGSDGLKQDINKQAEENDKDEVLVTKGETQGQLSLDKHEGVTATAAVPRNRPDKDRFYEKDYTQTLARFIRLMIKTDGPISAIALARKVAHIHGMDDVSDDCLSRVVEIALKVAKFRKDSEHFYIPG